MSADVYKQHTPLGTLIRRDDRTEFTYLANYQGDPVASTLPLRPEPYVAPAGQLPAFFVGLLPEGRRLSSLVRALKVSADDELSLLLAVGSDTIGDVRVVAAGSRLSLASPLVTVEDWSAVDLQEMFERSLGVDFDPISIPGIQPKMSGQMISFPAMGSAGPSIVKLDPPEYQQLVSNEAVMLGGAAATGLFEVPPNELVIDGQGNAGLIVSRFDRVVESDPLPIRLPVEDGCQALGRYPADKYNVDVVDVVNALGDLCSAPQVARLQLFQRFLLSYLAGDGGFHARNASVYRTFDGLWRPSPVYDLVCTAVYQDMTLALPFAGKENITEMGRRRLVDGAVAMGLPARAVEHVLNRDVPVIADSIAVALDSLTFSSFPSIDKVKRFLRRRADKLLP